MNRTAQLIGLLLLTAAAGVALWLYYRRRSEWLGEPAPDFNRPDRDILTRPGGNLASGLTGGDVLSGTSLLVGGTPIPMTARSYYTPAQLQALVTDSLPRLKARYGDLVEQTARNSDVPEWLIYAKMLVENGQGNPTAVGGGAVGLMQIKPLSAHEHVLIAQRKGILSEAEKAVLQRKLGAEKLRRILTSSEKLKLITEADLMDPEVNLTVGGIFISVYLDEAREGMAYNWAKLVARYNQGYYFANRGRNLVGSTEQLLGQFSEGLRNYVLKYVGKNGVAAALAA